ncbi:hypothetical protein [Promicromonospora soli]
MDNQNRTLTYLRLSTSPGCSTNFRANHKLSTNGAAACGGYYICHYGYTLRLDPITTTTGRGDATFR